MGLAMWVFSPEPQTDVAELTCKTLAPELPAGLTIVGILLDATEYLLEIGG